MHPLSRQLLDWYQTDGRKHLPWQQDKSCYRVWVSEVMLQQTQVKTVIPYYQAFMQSFPDVYALASADEDSVLAHWSGLGYYSRARHLHLAAKTIVTLHNGQLPTTIAELVALPGVGKSTACAILSITHNLPTAILDGNVKRVLSRLFLVSGYPGKTSVEKTLWTLAEELMPATRCSEYTQAIMDLGATVCTRTQPKCTRCPLSNQCKAYDLGKTADYPMKKAQKTMPVRDTRFIVMLDNNRQILLKKRQATGLWGGLWSLPESPAGDVAEFCLANYQCVIDSAATIDTFRHSFSHYHLNVTVILTTVTSSNKALPGDKRWVKALELAELGLAQPVKKTLEKVFNTSYQENCLS